MKNSVGWFEIPTKNIERAGKFYAEVFETEFQKIKVNDAELYIFLVNDDSK